MRTIVLVATLATASCATLQTNGPTQRVTVTSAPPAAEIFLDGRAVGVTPSKIVVGRRNVEPIVRIEKAGFRPSEQALRRSTSWWLLSDVALGGLISFFAFAHRQSDGVDPHLGHTLGMVAGATPVILDYLTGAAFKFPSRVTAALEPASTARRMEVPRSDGRWACARPRSGRDLAAVGLERVPTRCVQKYTLRTRPETSGAHEAVQGGSRP